ncbi:hypothetical protein Y695_02625 [Hydrogenophaga sp. T4]|nr:hypothetical protein Y695_02625 [Hydrogenophaga sp. T4]
MVRRFGLVARFGELLAEPFQLDILPLLAPDVADQKPQEEQHDHDLARGQTDHQQALLLQLLVAFVQEARDRPVGLAREFGQRQLQRVNAVQQQLALLGVVDQLLRLCKQRIGDLDEVVDQRQRGGVFVRRFEQVAAGDVGQQVDAAEENLVAFDQRIAVDFGAAGVRQALPEPPQLAFELVGLPHDRIDLVVRHIVEQAELPPLDPAQRGEGDRQQQGEGNGPLPTLPAGQIRPREPHCTSRALSCQIERS